jgi:hypothetical protein
MVSIHIAAGIVTLAAVAILLAFVFILAPRSLRSSLLLLTLLEIPLQPLAFQFARLPLDRLIRVSLDPDSILYVITRTLYAPVTEELAKLLPLALIPAFRHQITRQNFPHWALAIGIGFGIGEAWFIASRIDSIPAFQDFPWWAFSGYMIERFMVCGIHAALTGTALHFAVNLPITLLGQKVLNFPPSLKQFLLPLWVMLCFAAAAVFLTLHLRRPTPPALPPGSRFSS